MLISVLAVEVAFACVGDVRLGTCCVNLSICIVITIIIIILRFKSNVLGLYRELRLACMPRQAAVSVAAENNRDSILVRRQTLADAGLARCARRRENRTITFDSSSIWSGNDGRAEIGS